MPFSSLSSTSSHSTGSVGSTSIIREDLEALALSYRRVCVVGLGYVGLPTALLFSLHDFTVQGVDVSPRVLENIQTQQIPAVYPELAEWWEEVQSEGHFRASNQPEPADVFIITVPTPVESVEKTCDLSMVRAAAESILPVLKPGNLVILESTVPPGTTRNVLKPMIEERTGLRVGQDIHLCFSPERVLPGNTTHELIHNDRVVGGTTPETAVLGVLFFRQVIQGQLFPTTDVTAEFCKLAENTYRDVNIALANELSILADEYGVDMAEARTLINMHPRVNLLKPGIGVGGHCIAVDPWFFVEASPMNTRLIATSRLVNDRMPDYTAQKIIQAVQGVEHPKICLVGLTYKPDVADTRESPARRIVELLQAQVNLDVVIYDPLLPEFAQQTLAQAAEGADYLGVLVAHTPVLETLQNSRAAIESVMRRPVIHIF